MGVSTRKRRDGDVMGTTQVSGCCGILLGLIGTVFNICPKSRAECDGMCLSSVPELRLQRKEGCDFEARISTYRDSVSKINKCSNKKPDYPDH